MRAIQGEIKRSGCGGAHDAVDGIDAERLLGWMEGRLDVSGLSFASRPAPLGAGGEAHVDAFRLANGPSRLCGPLVLRRLHFRPGREQVLWESIVHDALAHHGYPAPRMFLADADGEALGYPIQIMERLEGGQLLSEVRRPAELARRPGMILRLLREALSRVPRLLAEQQSRLHALDVSFVRDRLREVALAPRKVGIEGLVDRLEGELRRASLSELEPGLAWLRRCSPPDAPSVLCHGDFVFTNIMVDEGRVAGVFDWSRAALAHPAYDVAGTLARLGSPVPGVAAPLRGLFRLAQRELSRRYLAAYAARRSLDRQAVGYFEAYWILFELVRSEARRRQGATWTERIEDRWLHPAAFAIGAERFRDRTGVALRRPDIPAPQAGRPQEA